MTVALVVLAIATAQGAAQPVLSCRKDVGLHRAEALVRQCRSVSPATHPPCNIENRCSIILHEIQRSCAYIRNRPDGQLPRECLAGGADQ